MESVDIKNIKFDEKGLVPAVVQAFLQAAPDLAAGARVVLVLHDGGAPYLDTVYNDAWVARQLGVGAGELARRLDLNAST